MLPSPRSVVTDVATLVAVVLLAAGGCRKAGRADLSGDTTLARDLARVQMETAGAATEAGSITTPADSVLAGAVVVAHKTVGADTPYSTTAAHSATSSAATRSSGITGSAPPATAPATTASVPRTNPTGTADTSLAGPCGSPDVRSQRACIAAHLRYSDARLNQVYRELITSMRKRDGATAGAPDPPSVRQLRAAQRQWVVVRDNECLQRGRRIEGKLWAPVRARCLGAVSNERANQLEATLNRLRGD